MPNALGTSCANFKQTVSHGPRVRQAQFRAVLDHAQCNHGEARRNAPWPPQQLGHDLLIEELDAVGHD